ncbi:uncharacterized protein [Haliotis asinina]|uniref:uncharacterized protein n=1 Tax=Haliotis asinina TaxID=109174 RepID=UPI003532064F
MKLCILLIAASLAVVYGQGPSQNNPTPTGPAPGMSGPLSTYAQQQQRMQQQRMAQQQQQQQYFNPWSFYILNQIDNPWLRYMALSQGGFNPYWFLFAN